jgi:hypothetical protein
VNTEEFAGKVEWEGGIEEALHYGLKSTDIDDNPELALAWADMEATWKVFQHTVRRVEELLPDDAW